MEYVILASGLVLIVVAWLCYQYPNLINPYGSMPPERKALVNIEGLKKASAIISGVTGLLLVIVATLLMLKVIDEEVSGVLMTVFLLAMMVPLFIAMKKYNGFGRDGSGKIAKSTKTSRVAWIVSGVITGVTVLVVAVILISSIRPSEITVGEETITISGSYGREIPVSDVVSVDLLDEMPPIAMRTNGSDTGHRLKGHFKLKSGEKCMVFVVKQAPYIELRTSDNLYYLNADSKEETNELFLEIKKREP